MKKAKKVVFVWHSGSPERLERHGDALGMRVLVSITAGMERDPVGKGLRAVRGDMFPPKTAAGHFLRAMELTPALRLIFGGWQESEKGKSR